MSLKVPILKRYGYVSFFMVMASDWKLKGSGLQILVPPNNL